MYGVSMAASGQMQENVLMSKNACYAATQDLHTTGDTKLLYGCIPET